MPLYFDSDDSNSRLFDFDFDVDVDEEKSNQSELSWQSSARKRPRLDDLTLQSPSPAKTKKLTRSTHRYRTRLAVRRDSSLLRSLIVARFNGEFLNEERLRENRTSELHRCVNRLDGLVYTIKSSKETILGTTDEEHVCREMAAQTLVIDHEHFIRYYSAWIEPTGRFYMQFEHSSIGTLDAFLSADFDEEQLKVLLHQLVDALHYLHRQHFAHLNVQPSNILVSPSHDECIIYKLMDLSHVRHVDEGMIDDHDDPTYLPLEWRETSIQLDKIDIFALGLTLYACAMGDARPLPSEGASWIQLRKSLPTLDRYSEDFNFLLSHRMCHLQPAERASAREVNRSFSSTAPIHSFIHSAPVRLDSPSICRHQSRVSSVSQKRRRTTNARLSPFSRRRALKLEREKNLVLKTKLLDQYLQVNSFDFPLLSETSLSPRAISNAMPKPQIKSVGSNIFRYYSSVI